MDSQGRTIAGAACASVVCRVLCILVAWTAAAACSANVEPPVTVDLVPETALLSAPSSEAAVVGIVQAPVRVEPLETRRVILTTNPASPERQHPLTLRVFFHRIATPDGGEAWASPDLLYDRLRGRLVPRTVPSLRMQFVVLAASIAFAVLVWVLFRRGDLRRFFSISEPLSRGTLIWCAVSLVALYWLILSVVLFLSGPVIAAPTDEIHYFRIAQDILALRRPAGWSFNISVGLFYVPFMLATGAKQYSDIAGPVVFVESVILTPVSYLLVFSILGVLTRAWRQSFLAVCLLIVVPLVYCPVEFHAIRPGVQSVFNAYVHTPLFNAGSYHLYYLFVWYGRNGLSDTPAALLALLTVFLCVRLLDHPASVRGILWASALFGLACFMRINNVFLSPLAAYCFWRNLTGGGRCSWGRLAGVAGASVGVFMSVFSPQLVANMLQFGSPLAFPYVLHSNGAAEGFEFSALPGGTAFLVCTNFAYVVWFVTGGAFSESGTARRVLILWVVPMFLFFCGYVVVGASPMRFTLPLYGGLIGALVTARFWRDASSRERMIGALLIALSCVLVSPCARSTPPFPLGLDALGHGAAITTVLAVLVAAGSAGAAVFLLRPPLRHAVLFFLVVYHLGSAVVVAACLLALLVREGVLWAGEIRRNSPARAA
jgi:hypothetical protein